MRPRWESGSGPRKCYLNDVNITLVDPLLDYMAHCVSENLGLLYLAAALREAGHQVRIESTGLGEQPGLNLATIDRADWIGVTATSAIFPNAVRILHQIRAYRPEVPVVIGGAHASVSTADALQPGFDFAMV